MSLTTGDHLGPARIGAVGMDRARDTQAEAQRKPEGHSRLKFA
jgi:hypothetical protein